MSRFSIRRGANTVGEMVLLGCGVFVVMLLMRLMQNPAYLHDLQEYHKSDPAEQLQPPAGIHRQRPDRLPPAPLN